MLTYYRGFSIVEPKNGPVQVFKVNPMSGQRGSQVLCYAASVRNAQEWIDEVGIEDYPPMG